MIVAYGNPACYVRIILAEFKVCIGLKQRRGGVGAEDYSAAPDTSCRVGFEVETSDDAEVVLTAFERGEEVGVRCGVCVDDFTTCKNNLEVHDMVARPSFLGTEERYTA